MEKETKIINCEQEVSFNTNFPTEQRNILVVVVVVVMAATVVVAAAAVVNLKIIYAKSDFYKQFSL